MTTELIETRRVVCNSCGETVERSWNKARGDEAFFQELVDAFFQELVDKGWIYDEDSGKHFCPDCSPEEEE